MINVSNYIHEFNQVFPSLHEELPWDITSAVPLIVAQLIKRLDDNFIIKDNIAIHKDAIVESNAVIKEPAIISAHCFVASHTYLRNGVFLGSHTSVGPGCEIKTSLIFSHTSLAHFNFIGDSIVGEGVNMEAGAVIANHFNERKNKIIKVFINGDIADTGSEKFGALIGDQTKIGANAVLSPGTILEAKSVVKRLELIEQIKA